MQAFYYTKANMYGIPKGHVEMFQEHAAVQHMREGTIEPFDANKHKDAPGAKDAFAHALASGVELPKNRQPIKG